jgi:uncharacterized protein (DUF433 family)
MTELKQKRVGRFIVTDPKVCHGKPTFRGTRLLVSDVLELVAAGMDWDDIIQECRGRISRPAIAEAIQFARQAMIEHTGRCLPKVPV